jgi:rapamycin-insensitive companion of mTOR
MNVARQRLADLKLLDSSKSFPSSPPASSSSSTSSIATTNTSSTNTVQFTQAISHKIHSLKSPLLASVYETSIENLIDSQPLKVQEEEPIATTSKTTTVTTDEVDSIVKFRHIASSLSSPSKGSQQVTAEVHSYRHSSSTSTSVDIASENLQPIRRRRFNTLELDLSCTKNKFPIKHRSQDASITDLSGPLATSTLQRQRYVSTSANTPHQQQEQQQQSLEIHKKVSSSSSLQKLTSPLSPPSLGTLYCEQRLLQSRSEATLSSSTNNSNNNDNNNRILMMNRKENDEELR